MGDSLFEKQMEIRNEIMEEEKQEETPQPDKKRIKVSDKQLYVLKSDTVAEEAQDDEVMEIPAKQKKDKKKKKKVSKPAEVSTDKRVHFDMSQNKVTEFFKHGKVATRVLS